MTISSLMSTVPASLVGAVSGSNSPVPTSSTSSLPQESSGISELGSLMKQLQSLETSDPAKFKEVTSDIASKLQDAAKTAAAGGDSQGAQALNDLASKFTTASETGKMPHLHKGGHHHMAPPTTDADGDTSTTSATSSTAPAGASTSLTQYQNMLAMFQQTSSSDPFSTLTSILSSEFATQQ
jgi:hypothetical protein